MLSNAKIPAKHVLFASIILSAAISAEAATVHLVNIADTLDPTIGKSVKVDQAAIDSRFQDSISVRGALRVAEINGERCRREVILRTIQGLNVGTDDAVVVFYAGHGANDPRVGHYLSFPRIKGYLIRSELIAAIRAKRPRLGVVSTDCCNRQIVIPTNSFYPQERGHPPVPPRIKAPFRALFFDVTGFVDITSSQPGEASISYPSLVLPDGKEYAGRGGLWTSSLVETIDMQFGRPATWAEVTAKSARNTSRQFRQLVPDGLDNPADPAHPQMTQTPLISLDVRIIRLTDPDPDALPTPAPAPAPADDAFIVAYPKQRLGIHGYVNPGIEGLFVYATQAGSPAAKLGLERDDVILAINENKVRTAKGYQRMLVQAEGIARLTYRDVRTGRIMKTDVTLVGRFAGRARSSVSEPANRAVFGAAATVVEGGLRVDGSAPGSPAELVGLDPGDVITEINGRAVTTVPAYFAAVAASPDEMSFTVLNVRTGQKQGMVVTLDRP